MPYMSAGPGGGGTSQYKGVCWVTRRRKWTAYLDSGVPKRRRWLGFYDDERDAVLARDREALRVHGEGTWLNLPMGEVMADGVVQGQ